MSVSPSSGQVITFYSYKGGTGRSMALANFAWVLATAGKRVLAIDWDLEAPGLHRYFHPFLSDPELTSTEGVIDFVIRFIEAASARSGDESLSGDWYLPYARIEHYANSIDYAFPSGGLLDFISAGKQGEAYAARVNSLNWRHFYEKLGGWSVMEQMRESLRSAYDFILIDSRTGVSDTSGICTVQMPDAVVVCFTLNFQSVDGASAAARSIVEQRTRHGKPVRIFPVPMRVELSAEKIKYDQVSDFALRRFLPSDAEQAVLAGTPPRTYWDDVAVPYVGFYVFEEQLAWFLDLNRTASVLAATMRLAKYAAGVDVLNLPHPGKREREEVLAQYAAVWAQRLSVDYSRVCFVIIPFGKKKVGEKEVDFDTIYDNIFAPAIAAVTLPEGGRLEPRRTDKDFFAGDIKQDMFEYLEYSRFALAEISGLNFNVAYELGARHRTRESGTAIFRLVGAPLPFDISSIKAFPYEHEPEEAAEKSRELITRVLTESLTRNRIGSPIRIALDAQQQSVDVEPLLRDAENAIRMQDWETAMNKLSEAVKTAPTNRLARMKLGILLKDRGRWEDALGQFDEAVAASPTYGEAYREKGIAENKLAQQNKQPMDATPAPGEASLRRAIELNPQDFDALASLGGALRRARRPKEAREAYEKSAEVSGGHPYPLLNALKLRASEVGKLELTPKDRIALMRAERVRKTQTEQNPPFDSPWSFFDLAEIKLYQGKGDEFLQLVETGMGHTEADWQGKTFLSALRLLEPLSAELPKLKEGVELLEGILGKD